MIIHYGQGWPCEGLEAKWFRQGDNNCRGGTQLGELEKKDRKPVCLKRRPGEGVVEGARPLRKILAHRGPCRLEEEVRILYKYKFSINYCSRLVSVQFSRHCSKIFSIEPWLKKCKESHSAQNIFMLMEAYTEICIYFHIIVTMFLYGCFFIGR